MSLFGTMARTGVALKGGRTHTPQSSGSRQIIESQSANCFLCRQNMNWIGREKSKMVEWNRLKSNNYS